MNRHRRLFRLEVLEDRLCFAAEDIVAYAFFGPNRVPAQAGKIAGGYFLFDPTQKPVLTQDPNNPRVSYYHYDLSGTNGGVDNSLSADPNDPGPTYVNGQYGYAFSDRESGAFLRYGPHGGNHITAYTAVGPPPPESTPLGVLLESRGGFNAIAGEADSGILHLQRDLPSLSAVQIKADDLFTKDSLPYEIVNKGITAAFRPSLRFPIPKVNPDDPGYYDFPVKLDDAAVLFGVDHFNWYQTVELPGFSVEAVYPNRIVPQFERIVDPIWDLTNEWPYYRITKNGETVRVVVTRENETLVDPDEHPYYWKEEGGPGPFYDEYDWQYHESPRGLDATELGYADFPGLPLSLNPLPSTFLVFRTHLVGVRADGSMKPTNLGFMWRSNVVTEGKRVEGETEFRGYFGNASASTRPVVLSGDISDVVIFSPETAPNAVDDFIDASATDVVAGNVLSSNPAEADSDPTGDHLSVIELNGSAQALGTPIALESGAVLTLNSDGSFVYDPNGRFDELAEGEIAVDQFEYTITDGRGGEDRATVTITITGSNDIPTGALDGPAAGLSGQSLSFTFTATDIDHELPGEVVTYSIDWNGDGADVQTIVGPRSGVNVTHYFGNAGAHAVTLYATDNYGGTQASPTVHSVMIVSELLENGNLFIGGTDGDDRIRMVQLSDGSVRFIRNGAPWSNGIVVTGSITMFGGLGHDQLSMPDGTVPGVLYGGPGNDRIAGGRGVDQVDAGEGRDFIDGRHGDDVLFGDEGDDQINGNHGNDVIYGGPGNDRLRGYLGNDLLFGGLGRDYLIGDSGNNVLVGGEGADRLGSEFGRNILIGGGARDFLEGGSEGAILISGVTDFDDDEAALLALLAEWSASRSLAERVARITQGVGGASGQQYALTLNGTVRADNAWNVLTGGDGEDWFFKYRKDAILAADAQVDEITE